MKFIKVKNHHNYQYSESNAPREIIIQIDQIATITACENGWYGLTFNNAVELIEIDNNDAQRIFKEIGVSL